METPGPRWVLWGSPHSAPQLGDHLSPSLTWSRTLQRSLLQWPQRGRAEGREPGAGLASAIGVGGGPPRLGDPRPHHPQPGAVGFSGPAGPWGSHAGDGEGKLDLEAFCPAGPELQCQLLRTESLARFQGGKNPSPKRRECCLIKAAAGRRENSPLEKKSLSLEK